MLTFISGWKSPERDQAILKQRDPDRNAIFFVDNSSSIPYILENAPLIELYRNGRMDFNTDDDLDTLVRVNYDTENELIVNAVAHTLLNGADAQIIVTFDAIDKLYRLFPALRAGDALLAANERLDAQPGDRIFFTRGGSFSWRDHFIESQTALLTDAEVFDAGIVPEEVYEY